MAKILIVDDDSGTIESLSFIFKKENFEVFTASDGKEGIDILQKEQINIVLTDLMMPRIDGFELLKIIKSLKINCSVIVMTAYGTLESAVDILKEGAEDFIIKPLKKALVIKAVQKVLQKQLLLDENENLKKQLETINVNKIIGSSPLFKKVIDKIKIIANSPSTILIYGESGTGKELIAKEIHNNSLRSSKPFVAVNLSSLPQSLIEAELFGYLKGSFTGAITDKKGYFASADGGTLFLDEISELELNIQVKLLRFLQESEITQIGKTSPQKIDCKIIAATNKKLENLVKEGKFREDLFYRLNVIPVILPPLRERTEDIPLLIKHFLQKHSLKQNKNIINISNEAIDVLKNYDWPGNVRELENVIERMVVFSDGFIKSEDIPENILKMSHTNNDFVLIKIGSSMEDVEKVMIEKTLQFTKGDKELAAKILGISSRTIYRKVPPTGFEPVTN